MSGTVAPLPPYASAADFFAMEKGAIRKLAEPTAQAELPPTKDGYYHFGDALNEHELPAAGPHGDPHLAHQPYRFMPDGRMREVDEQKFLLSDVEIKMLKQKAAMNRIAGDIELQDMRHGGSSSSASSSTAVAGPSSSSLPKTWETPEMVPGMAI
jgi:hypothetical protein